MVRLFFSDDSEVAQTLLSRGLVKKSVLLNDEEPPQFYPQKRGPNKAKPVKSKRSITETRLVLAFKSSPQEGIVINFATKSKETVMNQ